jgi:hypothetical protein
MFAFNIIWRRYRMGALAVLAALVPAAGVNAGVGGGGSGGGVGGGWELSERGVAAAGAALIGAAVCIYVHRF